MFDNVTVKYPLPDDPSAPKADFEYFQTKDLRCDLSSYTITEDGYLRHDSGTRVFDPGEGFVAHHGDVYLCGGPDSEFWEYVVRFTEGRVTKIWLHDYWRRDT